MSSQRSFDASRLFGRHREYGEPRRAALRTSVKEIGEVPQNWTMRKQSMTEVNAPSLFNLCRTSSFIAEKVAT